MCKLKDLEKKEKKTHTKKNTYLRDKFIENNTRSEEKNYIMAGSYHSVFLFDKSKQWVASKLSACLSFPSDRQTQSLQKATVLRTIDRPCRLWRAFLYLQGVYLHITFTPSVFCFLMKSCDNHIQYIS